MANVNIRVNRGSFDVAGMLGVLFVGLKLTDQIDWSWWWVSAPFWGPVVLVVAILGGGLLAVWVDDTIGERIRKRKRARAHTRRREQMLRDITERAKQRAQAAPQDRGRAGR